MIDLVSRARRGDADAYATLVAGSLDRLYGAACLILRDRSRAEDAVQDGLIRAWRELPRLREVERFDAWLRRIVVHAALDELRRQRSRPQLSILPGAEPITYAEADLVIARDTLERGFARISPDHRASLVLRHYLGLTIPEIASTLGIPTGTAKSRLHHASQSLRAAIEADDRGGARSHTA